MLYTALKRPTTPAILVGKPACIVFACFFNPLAYGIFVREIKKIEQTVMRLGQLARKLELRPAEIIEFLATKNILIEDDANAKVEDNYVTLVFQQFAPDMVAPDMET